MSRATSAGVYGPSWIDAGRVAAKRTRVYALRTPGNMAGYAPAYGTRPRRQRREVVDPTTGLLAPIAPVSDDEPVRRYVRTDYAAERHAAGVIVMADF